MSDSGSNKAARKSGADEAEATLRLIANLPAPHGLEDRVRAHLLVAPRRGRVIAWPGSLVRQSVRDAGWMRSVAAAAIVCVVAGGGWGIYARVQGGQLTRSIAGPAVPGSGSSSFSTGEARRRPQTLNGPSISVFPAHFQIEARHATARGRIGSAEKLHVLMRPQIARLLYTAPFSPRSLAFTVSFSRGCAQIHHAHRHAAVGQRLDPGF
jgi:hypothetical protein